MICMNTNRMRISALLAFVLVSSLFLLAGTTQIANAYVSTSTSASGIPIVQLPPSRWNTKITAYVGNDNAEFGTSSTPAYVDTDMVLSSSLSYSEPDGAISLQFNPDLSTSETNQYNGNWFQAGIIDQSSSCFQYTVQIYSTSTGSEVWSSYLPSSTTCYSITGGESTNAYWEIFEDVSSSNHITSVFFEVGNGNTKQSGTIDPPNSNYIWIQSNLCLCGVDSHNATFSSASGTMNYASNVNLNAISPPSKIGTAESSNIEYGCLSGSGTTSMSQSFGLSGAC